MYMYLFTLATSIHCIIIIILTFLLALIQSLGLNNSCSTNCCNSSSPNEDTERYLMKSKMADNKSSVKCKGDT